MMRRNRPPYAEHSDSTSHLVQIIHPKGEPVPHGDIVPWNRDAHCRKFLVTRGRYIERERGVEGTIGFWGEWEPQSRAVPVASSIPGGPRWLHYPYYDLPDDVPDQSAVSLENCIPGEGGIQNTDPFVFGSRFLYAICLQQSRRGPTRMRYLDRGSVVLFGSRIEDAFVLDTLFVVTDYIDYERPDHRVWLKGAVAQEYEEVTLNNIPSGNYRLYLGATYDEPFHGMYSFVPCMPLAEGPQGFPRPEIVLDGAISPGLGRGMRYQPERSIPELAELWWKIREQVEDAGLRIGISAAMPQRRGSPPSDPEIARM